MKIKLVSLFIESLSHDGRGIAHIDGKTTFVGNALPGETVTAKILKQNKKFNEAYADIIENPHPQRIVPACTHFHQCGGCALQHLESEGQIQLKQQALLEHLAHFGQVKPLEILPPLTGPVWGYRHKARLSVKYLQAKNSVLIGFHEKHSSFVANIDACLILHPSVGQLITPLRNLLLELSIRESIPQIEVAIGDDITALILRHLRPFAADDLDKIREFAADHQLHIFLQPGNLDSVHLLYPSLSPEQSLKPTLISYELNDFNLKLFFHPNEFAQINAFINRKMIALAMQLLDPQPTDRILDLFSGFGNFTLPLSKYCQTIVGIDGNQKAIACGKQNALYNNLTNVEFYCHELNEECLHQPWARKNYNKILLDPPRVGAQAILPLIGKLNPEKILYISCNPATFARDAGELVARYRYRLVKCGAMDMFPHTKHIESIALFSK